MTYSIVYAGIDPDTEHSGVALIWPDGKIELKLARAKGRLAVDRAPGMAQAIRHVLPEFSGACFYRGIPGLVVKVRAAVEWQHQRKQERNPNAMMGVQAVAGMAVAALSSRGVLPEDIKTPLPHQWKGSIPKEVHQRRLLRRLNLTADSPEFHGIPKSMQEHVIDALGLAVWMRDQS